MMKQQILLLFMNNSLLGIIQPIYFNISNDYCKNFMINEYYSKLGISP